MQHSCQRGAINISVATPTLTNRCFWNESELRHLLPPLKNRTKKVPAKPILYLPVLVKKKEKSPIVWHNRKAVLMLLIMQHLSECSKVIVDSIRISEETACVRFLDSPDPREKGSRVADPWPLRQSRYELLCCDT